MIAIVGWAVDRRYSQLTRLHVGFSDEQRLAQTIDCVFHADPVTPTGDSAAFAERPAGDN